MGSTAALDIVYVFVGCFAIAVFVLERLRRLAELANELGGPVR